MRYTPNEIEKMLSGMIIYVDTREQQTENLTKRLELLGCSFVRKALKYGDYSCGYTDVFGKEISLENVVVIERKMSLDEISTNFTSGRSRFIKEFEKAKEDGCKVHILIENDDFENLYNGNYRSRIDPAALSASLLTWKARYSCDINFCKAYTTGKLIRDTLYYHLREHLQSLE